MRVLHADAKPVPMEIPVTFSNYVENKHYGSKKKRHDGIKRVKFSMIIVSRMSVNKETKLTAIAKAAPASCVFPR